MSTSTKIKNSSSGRRLYGVLLHPCSGKTSLANSLHGKKVRKDVVFIDVDANVKYEPGQTSIDYFPKIKKSIDKAYTEYPEYKIVVISSNQKLFEYLKINKGQAFVYIPNDELFLKMLIQRGLLDTPLDGTDLNNSVAPEDTDLESAKKRKGSVFSLGKEQNNTQTEVEVNADNFVELYNKEIKSILLSRKELFARKHKKYESLDNLISRVFKDILKQKDQ